MRRRVRIAGAGPFAALVLAALVFAAIALATTVVTTTADGSAAASAAFDEAVTAPGTVTAPRTDAAPVPDTAGTRAAAGDREPAADIDDLTLRQMAGQRVIYGYYGLEPPRRLFWLIRHGQAGGVVFFAYNITSRTQIAGVIRRLKAANANPANPVRAPLLLMVDQEGGYVRRLPGAPVQTARQIGDSANPSRAAKAAGAAAARNLRGTGLNLDLAPVLDVYRRAGNFIDRTGRSFGKDPRKVAEAGSAFISALQARGVAATAKHFPGLGAAAASQNTDSVPATLTLSRSALRGIDELPYRSAIATGVKLVMLSWAVYPRLDPKRPAGFSPAIVQGELRDRLGFEGVTITDSLAAGALRSYRTLQQRTLLAAKAGVDIMLGGGRTAEQCTDALVEGYTAGRLNKAAFREAVQRVLELRASLPE